MPFWKATYWQEKVSDLFNIVKTADRNFIYKNFNFKNPPFSAMENITCLKKSKSNFFFLPFPPLCTVKLN